VSSTPVRRIGLNILFHVPHILLALKQTDTQMHMAADNGSLIYLHIPEIQASITPETPKNTVYPFRFFSS